MNKTLKKTLSIILTVLMIVTTIPFAFAAYTVASGSCGADGDNLTWTLDSDGTLTISGTGAMATYSIYENLPPWAGHKENIKKIVIEEGVTELGMYAFFGHTAVKYVSIADTVTTFNGREFHGCSAIEKLIIPAGVSVLSSTSFQDCSSLKKIVFLGKVDLDSFYAFDGCSELREIVFAKGATNNNAIGVPFTNEAINVSETVIHFGGTQAEAEAAFAPIKEWDKIYSVATIHYIDGCNCSVCGEYHIVADDICVFCGYECFHESYTDGKCSVCDYECPHENCTDYICDNCGTECPHKTFTDSVCDNCGYECSHESYTDGKCSVCGYECPHESYTDGKCSVCDYECPHESITDCKCDACGTEVTVITITMTDSYGDSWSGNAIVIKQLVDGAYTEVATATVANGYGYTFSANLPAEDAYSLNWLKGSYSEDCSFTVAVDGETVYECANGRNLTDSEMFYVICKHISYTDGKCSACGSACTHENYTDSKCDTCGYECLHEGQNGSCEVCGANLGKLVIDVTDKSFVEIGNGYDYYDEDGYIITGTNQNASVNIIEETALTLSNLTLGELYFNNAPEDSVINITLDGTTEVTEYVSLYRAHLIFDGGETDIFKVPYFTTAGNSGSVTVNSGNIILDCVTEYNLSAIACDGGFTINGGTVTASNNYFYVVSRDVTLNGGELNIISTAADHEAISSDITMDKGALLTVSAESEILYKYGNIVMADGAQENDYFFVRYDTESEFVPVYDIRAALDGKTYAEIKIDTHEHSFENGKCVCGVARADYTAFDAAVNELNELLNYDRLLTNWKENYTENMRVYVSFVGNNRTEREQDVVDNATNTLNKFIASLKDSIEKGSALRADFTYMKSMIDQVNALIDNDPNNIIDSARGNYDGPTSYYNSNRNKVDLSQASYHRTMEEYQYEAQLESLLAGLKDGTMLKADYTEIDEVIAGIDEALKTATVSEEMQAELDGIKKELETLKAEANTSAADLANSGLLDIAEAVAETMTNCANGVHSFTKYEETEVPECEKAGKEVAYCDHGCGATDENEIPALEHIDEDGDYLCDHGCGHEFEKPAKPDTPDEPADDTCDHLCHKDGILGFLWKIISFFYRLFNIQQYCDCGVLHYDAPVFG